MKLTRPDMIVRFAVVSLFLIAIGGTAQDQHPMLDQLANKVIQKYQTSSCQQLAQQKQEPPSPEKVKAVQFLKTTRPCAPISSTRLPGRLPTSCLSAVS